MGNTQKNTPIDIQVRIDKLLDGDSSTKAFASATIGNAFAVHDITCTETPPSMEVIGTVTFNTIFAQYDWDDLTFSFKVRATNYDLE